MLFNVVERNRIRAFSDEHKNPFVSLNLNARLNMSLVMFSSIILLADDTAAVFLLFRPFFSLSKIFDFATLEAKYCITDALYALHSARAALSTWFDLRPHVSTADSRDERHFSTVG